MSENPTTPPDLVDLLADAPTNWGKWGADDEVGALNYLGPEQVLRRRPAGQLGQGVHAAAADRRPEGRPGVAGPHPGRADPGARRVQLGRAAAAARPTPAACTTPTTRSTPSCRARRSTTRSATSGTAARSGTATTPGPRSAAWTRPASQPIAERGIVGRGVLLDMARFRGKDNLDKGETFTHEDLHGLRQGAGRGDPAARHPGHPDELPPAVLRAGRRVLRGLQRARPRSTAPSWCSGSRTWRSRTWSPTRSPTRSPPTRTTASRWCCTAR